MGYNEHLEDYEQDELLTKLNIWATGHHAPNQAFMALMGRTLSPIQFYEIVRRAMSDAQPKTEQEADDLDFGGRFVRYLRQQSERHNEPLTASLDRAIRANQVHR